jgi:hypothetical protein
VVVLCETGGRVTAVSCVVVVVDVAGSLTTVVQDARKIKAGAIEIRVSFFISFDW